MEVLICEIKIPNIHPSVFLVYKFYPKKMH